MENQADRKCTDKVRKGRLLVFIVAYHAEKTIEDVLKRIPHQLTDRYYVEVLIIDDSSQDDTFKRSELVKRAGIIPFAITVLFNPVNQGYGGNQKIGFHYAIENGFDWVALVHGDGQYAPECLPDMMEPLASGDADAVFGSRMLEGRSALKGGMPLYKFVGNKILTTFQNFLLGSNLSEFHSGYRLYSTKALSRLPFALNSNDFHFDTEIIIQFITARLRIREIPIPTFYGDEICHVNGLAYAWNVCKVTMQANVQRYHIFYDRKFDCAAENKSNDGITANNIHSLLHKLFRQHSKIVVMGEVDSSFIDYLKIKGHNVFVDSGGLLGDNLIEEVATSDYLLIIDDRDLAQQPERLLSRLQELCRHTPDIEIIFAVGNIAFFLTRFMLLFGRFSYTRKGIVSLRHFRLFTLRSIKKLFVQNGFEVMNVVGVAIPYEHLFSSPALVALCTRIHAALIKLRSSFFSYQFVLVVKPRPSLTYLLASAMKISKDKAKFEVE